MGKIVLTKELLESLIEYMGEEKVEALEFDEKNFLASLKDYNDQVFGRPDEESSLH